MSSSSPPSSSSPAKHVNSLSSRYRSFCDTNSTIKVREPLYRPHDTTGKSPCGRDRIPDQMSDNNTNVNIARVANDGSGSEMEPPMKCCCGRNDCAYLEHNNVALEGLERNLSKAAELGQVRDF
jgi:hypothetical protein